MKKQKYITQFFITIIAMTILIACNKDEEFGTPVIDYVRITSPESADSLLVSGFQGSLIALIGKNLGHANDAWFNDVQAGLNPVYVTDESILVNIPNDLPIEVTNQIRLYFSNGDSLIYDFEVEIGKPFIQSMISEYVNDGEIATIVGNFFYEPLTVTFSGGLEGEVIPADDESVNSIRVIIPNGAEKGPITVTTNFGSVESDFWFRDDRNIIISSDPFTGWFNEEYVVNADSITLGNPPAINGNYIRITKSVEAWEWVEVAGGPANAMGDISKNFPDDAILNPEDYYLKFEINTIKPYNNNLIRMNFGLQGENNDAYLWRPPYDSEGRWETVAIPLEEIFAEYTQTGSTPEISSDGYWTRILIFDGNPFDCDLAFDNFRIVPKLLDD